MRKLPSFILLHFELLIFNFTLCSMPLYSRTNGLFYNNASAEIEVRDDLKLESDKKLDKLESFLGRLNSKGQ